MSDDSFSEIMRTILINGTYTNHTWTDDTPIIAYQNESRGSPKSFLKLKDGAPQLIQAVNGTIILEIKRGTITIDATSREHRNQLYADIQDIIEAETDYSLTFKRIGQETEQQDRFLKDIEIQIIEKS